MSLKLWLQGPKWISGYIICCSVKLQRKLGMCFASSQCFFMRTYFLQLPVVGRVLFFPGNWLVFNLMAVTTALRMIAFSLLLIYLEPSLLPTTRKGKDNRPHTLWINSVYIFHTTWIPDPYQGYPSFPWYTRWVFSKCLFPSIPAQSVHNHCGQTWLTDHEKFGAFDQIRKIQSFIRLKGKVEF